MADDQFIDLEVEEFLGRFKAALVLEYPKPWWHQHFRRLQEVADLNITQSDVLEHLKHLQAKHHYRGPEPDDAEPNIAVVHIFKYRIDDGTEVYVKIGLKQHPEKKDVTIPKIWSFKRWGS